MVQLRGCIVWKGSKDGKGYGLLRMRGSRMLKAHRVAYRLFHGELKRGMQICHSCDNPGCINPKHLFQGTQSENQKDSVAKGRHWSTRKTKCPKGHLLSGGNLYARRDGTRECKECRRENVRRHRGVSG